MQESEKCVTKFIFTAKKDRKDVEKTNNLTTCFFKKKAHFLKCLKHELFWVFPMEKNICSLFTKTCYVVQKLRNESAYMKERNYFVFSF